MTDFNPDFNNDFGPLSPPPIVTTGIIASKASPTAASLLLDTEFWDLCVTASGDIAVCTPPYSYAQDAACHLRLFEGELRYDMTQGVPYFESILGHWPAPSVLRAYLTQQALLATGVGSAQMFFAAWSKRAVSGVVNLEIPSGATSTTFSVPASAGAP